MSKHRVLADKIGSTFSIYTRLRGVLIIFFAEFCTEFTQIIRIAIGTYIIFKHIILCTRTKLFSFPFSIFSIFFQSLEKKDFFDTFDKNLEIQRDSLSQSWET